MKWGVVKPRLQRPDGIFNRDRESSGLVHAVLHLHSGDLDTNPVPGDRRAGWVAHESAFVAEPTDLPPAVEDAVLGGCEAAGAGGLCSEVDEPTDVVGVDDLHEKTI